MLKKVAKAIGRSLEWLEKHERLVTAIINLITALLLLYKAS